MRGKLGQTAPGRQGLRQCRLKPRIRLQTASVYQKANNSVWRKKTDLLFGKYAITIRYIRFLQRMKR
uniref:Uncharacterized protein n=1 Tax=Neisseria meningitidis alpha275 TaxID=295996 RepID=C6SLD2_NEIME|nr:hypothetical protein predicted by Glimmer/Critica [Neisseria meningitidis alpha275]